MDARTWPKNRPRNDGSFRVPTIRPLALQGRDPMLQDSCLRTQTQRVESALEWTKAPRARGLWPETLRRSAPDLGKESVRRRPVTQGAGRCFSPTTRFEFGPPTPTFVDDPRLGCKRRHPPLLALLLTADVHRERHPGTQLESPVGPRGSPDRGVSCPGPRRSPRGHWTHAFFAPGFDSSEVRLAMSETVWHGRASRVVAGVLMCATRR